MSKPLSEMLEEIEPKNDENDFDMYVVDRASYEKLRQVAIELAKGLDVASNVYVMSLDERTVIDGAIHRAKDILRGG